MSCVLFLSGVGVDQIVVAKKKKVEKNKPLFSQGKMDDSDTDVDG